MSRPTPSLAFADSAHLSVDGLSVSFRGRRVLSNISFSVPAGDRVGLIGENGSGKSTLLRVIVGDIDDAVGSVSLAGVGFGSPAPVIGLLRQEPPFAASASVNEVVDAAVAPMRRAGEAVSACAEAVSLHPDDPGIAAALGDALDVAERFDVWNVDSRVQEALAGLGLAQIRGERTAGSLSGGQRARLALAQLLLSAPDVLLLDEPTNHLDDAATEYLVRALAGWRGPVMMASHDRAFLDEAATSLLDLDPSPLPQSLAMDLERRGGGSGVAIGVTRFGASFSRYREAQAATWARWATQYRDEQRELGRLRDAVQRTTVGHADRGPRSEVRAAKKFYADRNANVVARRVNNARTRLEALEASQIRKPPARLEFAGFTTAGHPRLTSHSGPILAATQVIVGGRLGPVSLSVGVAERLLITGSNGSGKSTLLAVLAGSLRPTAGQIYRAPGVRVGLLTQDVVLPDPFERGLSRTAEEAYRDLVGVDRAAAVPLDCLGLLAGADRHRPVCALSVGQQRRLSLAILLADPPDVLLLDEPTNHLSLGLVSAIEREIGEYPGTVVVASHDRWLRDRWEGSRISLPG